MQSVEEISICSWWKLAINIIKSQEACRVVMTLITSFNIRNRGRRCKICYSFEPDTLDHMVARCDFFVNQRTEFINELCRSCEYCYERYTSEGLMTFILREWAEHSLVCMGPSIVSYLPELERRRQICGCMARGGVGYI